ncbi:MAG: PatB family C-S lyase [Rhodobacteraceae bacterium]|nr:PatB family C-S lyase [Paracoccaceae bacterium]PHR51366.1 MAG: aminotransferase [Robiginitomaculum sp.]
MTPEFNFDEEINRREVPALKVHKMVLGADGMSLFAAGVADMDFRAPPVVLEALSARLSHGVFGYETVPDGLIPALTNWLKTRHDWAVDPAHILRAPNVLNALAMAANLFTNAGDGIIIQPPVFFDFADIISENGRRIVENPLLLQDGRYQMDFDGLAQLASDPRTKMLFLCNPHNPVGRVWTRAELTRLGKICRAHNVLVVADEIHADITYSEHGYTPFATLCAADAQNSITCLSPAKSFNIAACCSAFTLIADDKLRLMYQAENSRLTVNKNNAFASVAMQVAYRDGGPWLDAATAYFHENIELVRARLSPIDTIQLIEPEGTFLLWLDFRALGLSPDALTQFLRQQAGWAVTRGQSFGVQGHGFARLNIACPRARLEAALQQLAGAIEHHNHTKYQEKPK